MSEMTDSEKNLIVEHLFDEKQWYDVGSVQLPSSWLYYELLGENPYADGEENEFASPTGVHLWREMLPPQEQTSYLNALGRTYKLSSRSPFLVRYDLSHWLEVGLYRLALHFYGDWYRWDNGTKQPPTDPQHGRIKLHLGEKQSEWILPTYLGDNEISAEFKVTQRGQYSLGFIVLSVYSLDNNGLFLKQLALEKVNEPPINQAESVGEETSVNINVPIKKNTPFQQSWSFENSGNTTWNHTYQLAFSQYPHPDSPKQNNFPMTRAYSYPITAIGSPQQVAPGEQVTLTLSLNAPEITGYFITNWRLQDPQGRFFGPIRWIAIDVDENALPGYGWKLVGKEYSADVDHLGPGEKFAVTWNILNIGTTSWQPFDQISLSQRNAPETEAHHPLRMTRMLQYQLANLGIKQPIEPGQTASLTLWMVAPQSRGEFASHWQLHTEQGKPFGSLLWAAINVV